MKELLNIVRRSLEFKNEEHTPVYFLTHKEMVSEQETISDLLRCAIVTLRRFVDVMLKSNAFKMDPENQLQHLMYAIVTTFDEFKDIISKQGELKQTVKVFNDVVRANLQTLLPPSHDGSALLGPLPPSDIIVSPLRSPLRPNMLNTTLLDLTLQKEENDKQLRKDQLSTIFRTFSLKGHLQQMISNIFLGNSESIKFRQQCSEFLSSKTYEDLAAAELKNLMRSENSHGAQNNNFKLFFKSLVEYLNPDKNVSDNIVKIGLKIFRELANKSIRSVNTKSAKFRSALVRMQNFLISIGTVDLLCKQLLHHDNLSIVDIVIDVSSQILLDGNLRGQTEFCRIMKDTSQGNVLKKIDKMLSQNFDHIQRLMISHNADQMRRIFFGETTFAMYQYRGFSQQMTICTKLLRLFQLLCEGHNSELQNFLREQHPIDAPTSKDGSLEENIDFISQVVVMFGSFVKFFNRECYQLGVSLIDFLIEAIQGPCKGNQLRVIKFKVLDFCKDFINDLNSNDQDLGSRGFDMKNQEHAHMLNGLFNKTIKLLLSILEFNYNPEIVEYIGSNIEFSFLIKRLRMSFFDFAKRIQTDPNEPNLIFKVNTKTFDEDIKIGFNVFFFVQILDSVTEVYSRGINELTDMDAVAFNFFKNNSGHLEINFQGTIQKVYFMKHPACNYLDTEYQQKLMNKVRRDSANEKVADFLQNAQTSFFLMDHTFNMTKKHKIRPVYLSYTRDLALLVSFGLNLYLFVYLEKEVRYTESFNHEPEYFKLSFSIIGWVHLGLGILMVLLHLVLQSKLSVLQYWTNYVSEFSKEISRNLRRPNSIAEDQVVAAILEKDVMDMTSEELKIIIKYRRLREGDSQPVPTLIYHAMNFKSFLWDATLIYFLFYVLFSALAKFRDVKILYSISLFDVINRFDTLRNVIKAITHNKYQLILTALLGTVIIYIYSLFGYYYLIDDFWNPDFGEGGSIGDLMVRQSYQPSNKVKWYVRFTYDVSIFVVVNIVLMNVIFGIIIDTFAALRDKKTKINLNKDTVCFVCSLDKNTYDKTPEGYEYHVRVDHNVWNYLFYIYYIKKEPQTEYTGVDSYVSDMLRKEDIFWFPIGKSLAISQLEDNEDSSHEKFNLIFERLKQMVETNRELLLSRRQRSSNQLIANAMADLAAY